MGAGASAAAELTDEEKAKFEELQALSPEAQAELAVAAMKDVLTVSATFAIQEGQKDETWCDDEQLAIPVPMLGSFEKLAENVGKIPMVGSSLAGSITGMLKEIELSFADAAKTMCADPEALATFVGAAEALSPEVARECGERGGTAYVDYLFEAAGSDLAASMAGVAGEALKTHKLTMVWDGAIKAYNSAASKLGQDKLEFDLPGYVTGQTLASLQMLISRKESAIRGGDVDGTTDNVVKVFGGGLRAPEELIKALVLVKKGDPRALSFGPAAAGLQGTDTAALGRDAESLAGAPCVAMPCGGGGGGGSGVDAEAEAGAAAPGLHLVSRFSGVRVEGSWHHVDVGVGVPSQAQVDQLAQVCADRQQHAGTTLGNVAEAADAGGGGAGLLGAPVALVRRGGFLYLLINGDALPLAVYKWRFFEGNKVVACRHVELNSTTWRANGGNDFVVNAEDGTISPAKAPQFVLGIRLVEK